MKKRVAGFSIVELMVTILVLAILLAIAVPAFRGTMRRSYISEAASGLMGDLQYARGEAAARHKYVSLCRSTDGETCLTSTDKSFDTGWLVYAYDGGTDGPNQEYSSTGSAKHTLLRVTGAQQRASIMATDGNIVTFNQSGLPVANDGRTGESFVVCVRAAGTDTGVGENPDDALGSKVTLNPSGGIVSAKLAKAAACSIE